MLAAWKPLFCTKMRGKRNGAGTVAGAIGMLTNRISLKVWRIIKWHWQEDDVKEDITFTSEVLAKNISSTFELYGDFNIDKWIICQTADNTSVNKKTAELLGIVHVPCKNHVLNSEVYLMTSSSSELTQVLKSFKNYAVMQSEP